MGRALTDEQQATLTTVMEAEGDEIHLIAQPGSGTGALVQALCEQALDDEQDSVLIVSPTQTGVIQAIRRLQDHPAAVQTQAMTGGNFRVALTERRAPRRVLAVTHALLRRQDVQDHLGARRWTWVVIADADLGPAGATAIGRVPWKRARVHVTNSPFAPMLWGTGTMLLGWPAINSAARPSLQTWTYRQDATRDRILARIAAAISPTADGDQQRDEELSLMASSPAALEDRLLLALSSPQDDPLTRALGPEVLVEFVEELDGVSHDSQLQRLTDGLRELPTNGRAVVLCRKVATIDYVASSLAADADEDLQILRVDSTISRAEQEVILERWAASRSALILGASRASDLDLRAVDLVVVYDTTRSVDAIVRLTTALRAERPWRLAFMAPEDEESAEVAFSEVLQSWDELFALLEESNRS